VKFALGAPYFYKKKKEREMTNNDKAITALDRLSETTVAIEPTVAEDFKIIRQALTPQSSADLGRVRSKINVAMAHLRTVGICVNVETVHNAIDRAQPELTEALRLLDEVERV
jgi:hypothetical protein